MSSPPEIDFSFLSDEILDPALLELDADKHLDADEQRHILDHAALYDCQENILMPSNTLGTNIENAGHGPVLPEFSEMLPFSVPDDPHYLDQTWQNSAQQQLPDFEMLLGITTESVLEGLPAEGSARTTSFPQSSIVQSNPSNDLFLNSDINCGDSSWPSDNLALTAGRIPELEFGDIDVNSAIITEAHSSYDFPSIYHTDPCPTLMVQNNERFSETTLAMSEQSGLNSQKPTTNGPAYGFNEKGKRSRLENHLKSQRNQIASTRPGLVVKRKIVRKCGGTMMTLAPNGKRPRRPLTVEEKDRRSKIRQIKACLPCKLDGKGCQRTDPKSICSRCSLKYANWTWRPCLVPLEFGLGDCFLRAEEALEPIFGKIDDLPSSDADVLHRCYDLTLKEDTVIGKMYIHLMSAISMLTEAARVFVEKALPGAALVELTLRFHTYATKLFAYGLTRVIDSFNDEQYIIMLLLSFFMGKRVERMLRATMANARNKNHLSPCLSLTYCLLISSIGPKYFIGKDRLHCPVRDTADGMLDFFELCSRTVAPLKRTPEDLDPSAIESRELVTSALDSYNKLFYTFASNLPRTAAGLGAWTCRGRWENLVLATVCMETEFIGKSLSRWKTVYSPDV